MEGLSGTLAEHVEELLRSCRGKEIQTTTGTQAAVEELIVRSDGLERIIRELAAELERLTARFERTISQLDETSGYSVNVPHP